MVWNSLEGKYRMEQRLDQFIKQQLQNRYALNETMNLDDKGIMAMIKNDTN